MCLYYVCIMDSQSLNLTVCNIFEYKWYLHILNRYVCDYTFKITIYDYICFWKYLIKIKFVDATGLELEKK